MENDATASLRGRADFSRFWWASSVSEFGTYFTTLAVQVLVYRNLHGSAADVGLVNGARWLPYLLFGLVAGVFVDRVRRRPVLVTADFVRAALLVTVPVLALTDRLSIWALMVFMAFFGLFSLVGDAASQSFLPRLVPVALLTSAHARTDQSAAVAQTSGPGLAGAVVGLIGAPLSVLVDAASYLFSAITMSRIQVVEPRPAKAPPGTVRRDVIEGLRWVYRHPTLAPLALTDHLWFVFSGIAGAILTPFVLGTLHLGPFALGLALSMAGVGGLAGSLLATRWGARFGTGRVVGTSHGLTAVAYALMALTPPGWSGWALLGLGQLTLGFSMGAANSNQMGYRQTATPDRLQGRTNATMRSINRAMIVVAAPLGGILADTIGNRPTMWIVAAGMAVVAVSLALSRFGSARVDDLIRLPGESGS